MSINELLVRLGESGIELSCDGDELVVRALKRRRDPALMEQLRENKQALLEWVRAGGHAARERAPLIELTPAEMETVAAAVEGGADNVQDFYPLAPLQEGMLFHHLLATEGDPYLSPTLLGFDGRERLDAYLGALHSVMARHDILRTSVVWEGLPEPLQVVWRVAPLPVEEVELDAGGDAARQLLERFDPRGYRIDVRRAPMLRACVAHDAENGRWLLLLLVHHMASDHTTLEVLQSEVRAHLLGRAHELPAPLPFRNLVAQARGGVSRAEHEAFFTNLLADVDEPTAPFGLLDTRGDGSGIEEAGLEVDAALAARVRERARRAGVSAASLCHVAWGQVLAAVSGRDDVVFGTVLFGRMDGGAGADRVVGPFINTLPVRMRVAGEGAEAGVRRMQKLLADLLRHEHAPLSLAQRCSGVQAPAPLFSALLNFRHGPAAGAPRAGAWEGVERVHAQERSNYPLTLSVDDRGEAFSLTVKAPAAVGPGRVCAMVHTALASLVDALETSPAAELATLGVLPDAELRQVTEWWNLTDAEFPADACVHELIEAQAERTPHAVAVVHEDRSLTYAELDGRANQLAHFLRARGVGPDVRVGICVERGVEMMVSLLAVLKAGGAYVPLDPSYPRDRLRYMLEDSAPAVLLAQAPLAGLFAGIDVPVVDVDDAAAWAGHPRTRPDSAGLTPDHLVYVIYTSGSTGRPKGVMNHHRCLVNRLAWGRRAWGMGADDAVLCKTSLSFDGSVREVFLPLTVGGRVVMARPDGHKDPDYLVETIRRERISTVNLVPSMLQLLLENPDVGGCTALRRVLCGGEAMPGAVAKRFHERLPHVELHNLYGPSEAATAVSMRVGADARGIVPIGRPIANTRVYLLDARGEPVAGGVTGELYIGGAGVARGYLNRAELTSERFVADPFSAEPGARMYRTGDVGRWLPDGTIEFLGRNDDQVKIRGFRVELGEIEARAGEHPQVREAVVVAREDAPGDRRLVAYYVGAAEVEALRAHLAERLPDYMVPAAYVRMEAFPLTPSGKLDRKALPAPEGGAFVTRAFEAPEGETEQALAAIWAEVIGVERVGRWDHFFELGGHSLLAVRVVSRVRQALGLEVAMGDIFVRPVLADFARGLREAGSGELPAIEPAGREGPLPLSFAQQRLWFLEELGTAGRAYHIPKSLRLRGGLHRGALIRALDRIVARHEALRTTFHMVDGDPVQRIAEESGFRLLDHDLCDHPQREAELRRLLAEESSAPFDLQRGPLIRGRLIRLAADDHVLLVTMHHIVSDGWSMDVVVNEMGTLYSAFSRGEPDPLPPLAVQYADYAVWQRRWVDGEVLGSQSEYWKRTLGGAPELLSLPADRPRPARQDHTGGFAAVELDEELTAGLKALGKRHGTTLFMTLMAGWAAVLGRLAGQDDVVIGTPAANRGRREVEGLVGFFVNTLALRMELGGAPTVAELLGRVKTRALEAQDHQDIPFEQVVELVQPVRSMAHSPLFQVLFSWHGPRGTLELPGLRLEPVGAATQHMAKIDLALTLHEDAGRIVGGVTYAAALFDEATVQRYLGYLRALLAGMVAGEHRPVDLLPLLPADERRRVVETFNATDAPFAAGACIHELFQAQAERTPDASAVTYEGRTLTYAELNARANQLAHYLRERGVGPDARVAVCVERGLEMVVGLLAVLKAGGAYVPLDPSYPRERLRYMLDDSAPVAVLTQAPLAGLFEGADVPVIGNDPAQWAGRPETNPARAGLTPEHLAYVIYTSGSTGKPKGVMNTHAAVANMLAWAQETWGLEAGESVLQRMSFSFDVSVRELFWPLAVGARMVVARADRNNDPDYLAATIRGERIGTLHLVPSLLQILLDHPEMAGAPLKRVMCGGEALPPALARRFRERLPEATLFQMYGPTETTVAVTVSPCPGNPGRERLPLGRPVANTRIYVLDRAGEPVPVGVGGEMYVGGAQVARGYLDRPALTAERFVADPFSGDPGARMYRTGDLGRWLPDGTIEFLGRNDEQVKVRGFRIELGEIEGALSSHSAVRDAVMMVREDAPGDRRLVAYYVPAAQVEAEVLRAHLAARLPEHMVPAAYVRMDTFPLTPNGKVDRKALPAPDGAAFATRGYEAPVGETEELLAGIWAELLGVERVGRNDHFFELGGHSLLATRLVLRVRQELEVELALREVFEMPVLERMAEHLLLAQLAQFDPEELARLSEMMPE